jgi:hypothetical protein
MLRFCKQCNKRRWVRRRSKGKRSSRPRSSQCWIRLNMHLQISVLYIETSIKLATSADQCFVHRNIDQTSYICRSVYNWHQIKHIPIAICVYRKICLVEFTSAWTARFCIDQHYNIIFQHRSRDWNAGVVKVDRDKPLDMMFSAATR